MTAPFRLEVLTAHHDREGFSCGVEALDSYFKTRVTQDMRRRVTACYVAVESATERLAGFYTLAAADIPLTAIPDPLIRKLPRYPLLPVARLGRLAVDTNFQGRRLGAALLWDAIARARRSELAVFALAVDAKDAQAAAFYQHHGFTALESGALHLFLPLTKLR